MQFVSLNFLVFLAVTSILYFAFPLRWRWLPLLTASWFYYGSWKPEYLFVLLGIAGIAYLGGLGIASAESRSRRRVYLTASIALVIGILCFFKYFNFVNDSLRSIAGALDRPYGVPHLDILLPVGISFYTFQSMSYLIDLYRGDTEEERHPGIVCLYTCFFPVVVSGPIERSTRLLPQLRNPRGFDYDRVTSGLQLIFWGFFKKLVIADRLAPFVNAVFDNPDGYHGFPVIIAVYFFAFQIYVDFSAYTDIAIGCARILGYDVMENFRRPYLAESVRTFWRRWHISLTSWFRDYLYIPLGGNRVSPWRWYMNILIVFLVSGAWHGANWTFVCWGALHGFFLIMSISSAPWRKAAAQITGLAGFPGLRRALGVIITFHLVAFAWIFFRAASVREALVIIREMADLSNFGNSLAAEPWNAGLHAALACVLGLSALEMAQERVPLGEWLANQKAPIRWGVYYLLATALLAWGVFSSDHPFIYAQF